MNISKATPWGEKLLPTITGDKTWFDNCNKIYGDQWSQNFITME